MLEKILTHIPGNHTLPCWSACSESGRLNVPILAANAHTVEIPWHLRRVGSCK